MGEPAGRRVLTILATWIVVAAVAVYVLALCGAGAVWAGAFLDALDAGESWAIGFALALVTGGVLLTWRGRVRR